MTTEEKWEAILKACDHDYILIKDYIKPPLSLDSIYEVVEPKLERENYYDYIHFGFDHVEPNIKTVQITLQNQMYSMKYWLEGKMLSEKDNKLETNLGKIYWHLTQAFDSGVQNLDIDLEEKARELEQSLLTPLDDEKIVIPDGMPASQIKDPITLKILDVIWALMNDERIKNWVEHGYGSSSPDIVGALDMYIQDAVNLRNEIAPSIKESGSREVYDKIKDIKGKLEKVESELKDIIQFQKGQTLKGKK